MRFALSFFAFLIFSVSAHSAEITAVTKVDAVTVFLSGAEITRTGHVKMEKGEHVVTIGDVPASAVPGSVRVEGKATGKLDIVSVDTRRTFLARADAEASDLERKKLEDEIERLRDEKSVADAKLQSAETQRALITNLAQLPLRPAPATGQPATADWSQVLSTIAQGADEASRRSIEAQVKTRDLDRKIEDLENKLTTLAPAKTEQTEVKVHVEAGSPLEADLTVRYQVSGAGWTPLYDARLQTGSKTEPPKLALSRRASISQTSGEDWQEAALQLSTARPAAGASAPELFPQLIDFEPEYKPMPAPVAKARREDRTRSYANQEDAMGDVAAMAPPAAAPAALEPVAEQQATLTSAPFEATFAVPGRVTVAGNGDAKRVMLATDEQEPVLTCRTVAKLDPRAYLYAKLTFANGVPLLPGQVYLFRDGTFVGTGAVPLLSPGEEHDLGFGLDDQVKVRHAIVEEKRGESGLISSSHTDMRNFRIVVKNMHERPINLVVIDQIPVSVHQDIKIEPAGRDKPSKVNIDDKRGVMSFEAKLEPDEEKVLEFGYRISWPAAKNIRYGR